MNSIIGFLQKTFNPTPLQALVKELKRERLPKNVFFYSETEAGYYYAREGFADELSKKINKLLDDCPTIRGINIIVDELMEELEDIKEYKVNNDFLFGEGHQDGTQESLEEYIPKLKSTIKFYQKPKQTQPKQNA